MTAAAMAYGSTTSPCSAAALATIVDLVGYGTGTSGANFFEGSGPAPTISAILSDSRASSGCTDTDDNATNFTAATPAQPPSIETIVAVLPAALSAALAPTAVGSLIV